MSHSSIINRGSKKYLRPVGCIQKGRSRTWLYDSGWWIGVIEFQPSSWSKGSYLNVGACFLWYAKDHVSFDYGYRINEHVHYRNDDQFEPKFIELAQKAAHRIMVLKIELHSPYQALKNLDKMAGSDEWVLYHSGIAAGLSQQFDLAEKKLLAVANSVDARDWAVERAGYATALLKELRTSRFDEQVELQVQDTRSRLKLEVYEDVLFKDA